MSIGRGSKRLQENGRFLRTGQESSYLRRDPDRREQPCTDSIPPAPLRVLFAARVRRRILIAYRGEVAT